MRKLPLLAVLLLPWLIVVGIFCNGLSAHGAEEAAYRIVLEDDADLLDKEDKTELIQYMKQIQSYGHVAFKSIKENPDTTEEFARQYYQEQFGTESGIVFIIDMQNLYLQCPVGTGFIHVASFCPDYMQFPYSPNQVSQFIETYRPQFPIHLRTYCQLYP